MDQAAAQKKKIFDSRYEILSIVGRGARSVVYHSVTTTAPFEHIALKVLTNKPGEHYAAEQLRKEALAMVAARHKYTVRLDDFHSLGQISYLAMEYAQLGDLRKYMHSQQQLLPIEQVQRFFLQITEALAFMHSCGILHRDIKPDNILIINERQCRIADFGVALLPGEPANIEDLQNGVGTMDYMAPEVLEGIESNKQSDVYLLGVTFYEALTGKQPFADIPLIEVIERRKTHNITPPRILRDELPQYLDDIIMRALEFDPAKRFESAEHLLSTINKAIAQDQASNNSQHVAINEINEVPDNEDLELDQLIEELSRDIAADSNSSYELDDDIQPSVTATTSPAEAFRNIEQSQKQATRKKTKAPRKKLKSASNLRAQTDRKNKVEQKGLDDFLSAGRRKETQTEHEQTNLQKGSSNKPVKIGQAMQIGDAPYLINDTEQVKEKFESQTEQTTTDPEYNQNNPSTSNTAISAMFVDNSVNTVKQPASDQRSTEDLIKEIRTVTEQRTKNYQDLYREKDRKKSRGFFTIILLVVIGIWLLDLGLKYWTNKGLTEHAKQISTFGSITNNAPIFSKVADQALQFPDLVPGLYSGQITGLITKESLPLVVSRADDADEIVFTVGLSGWQPARVSLKELINNKDAAIFIKSGGFRLQIKGSVQGNTISGTFINKFTQEQGTWSVTPIE